MKNQMKRFVAMLLASLAILALAGCSNPVTATVTRLIIPRKTSP